MQEEVNINMKNSYLKTIGEGIQNLLNVFFIFSCKAFSSRHQVVGSAADGPAVGSAYIHILTLFIKPLAL